MSATTTFSLPSCQAGRALLTGDEVAALEMLKAESTFANEAKPPVASNLLWLTLKSDKEC